MNELLLKETYRNATYHFLGHGPRNIKVLLDSFENTDPLTESDIYGEGSIISEFENEIATLLGKEKAVFFPSGTMAQQIALRIWCDDMKIYNIAYHPLAHLEIHEQDGLKKLHHIHPILLGEKHRLFTLDDLKNIEYSLSTVLIELPQREIGGQLPSLDELHKIVDYCKSKNIKVHLDGARLFEILPYYNTSPKEIADLFDSVYVSFYKGIGGIAGAILAGDSSFIEKAKIWKRRHGGDLISLYPYIISAKHNFDLKYNKMSQYYQDAKELAALFNSLQYAHTFPHIPVSNMFHVHFSKSKETVENLLLEATLKFDFGIATRITEINPNNCRYEISIGDEYAKIPKELLNKLFDYLKII
ncbi:MAG: aminotransferase class I/II-fold pyridoxal phosphate-dependent enzyme [Clostridiales bacterium]|nr:aminotransferase class I/II-fold pyridoxal phosphate-dependent enzyme [Clostridiales bacterium]